MANIQEVAEDNTSFQDEDQQSGEEEGEDYSNPEGEDEDIEEEQEDEANEKEDNLAKLLQQLKSSGAIRKVEKVTPQLSIPFNSSGGLSIKSEGLSIKPVAAKKPYCKTCDIDFDDTDELHVHLVEHVKLPYIVLTRLESEDEDEDNIDNWSDEEIEQEAAIPSKTPVANLDILKKLGGGISVNKPGESVGKVGQEDKKMEQSGGAATKSTIEKINTSGSLKLTIKSGVGKERFEVVGNNEENGVGDSNLQIKKEPLVLREVSTANSTPKELATITAASSILRSWETVDTKDGILEPNSIKKEPAVGLEPLQSSVQNSRPSVVAKIKDEPGVSPGNAPAQAPSDAAAQPIIPKPMIIPKKEPEPAVAIIEINGDDSDNDDIMFVDSTPPIEKKPTIGIVPTAQIRELPSSVSSFTTNQLNSPLYSSSNIRAPLPGSTEKQHNFNWNAPTKSLDSLLSDKSPDAILQNLLDGHMKESNSDMGASEYISLDTLGPKHTCDVCRTTFTDLRLLDNHRRATGHSNQIVTSGARGTSTALVPSSFGGNASLMAMNNILPVKQLAEVVAGKLANASGAGFSHQQNIMVNIHSFPQNVPPQMPGYPPQQMHGYPQPGYRMPDPNQPYPYPPQGNYQQYPPHTAAPPNYQMPGYPGQYPQNQNQPFQPPFNNQQAPGHPMGPYGQMMGQPGQGHPPGVPTSLHDTTGQQSPNKIGVMSGIKIQNSSQSPAPGQKLVQVPGPRIAAGVVRAPMRPAVRNRAPGGMRPVRPVRPGLPGQGQIIRGGKPMIRTPIKRPAENSPNNTPTKKKMDMLIPDRHDNEDCHVVSLQKQRDGVPFIESIKGRQETVQLGSGLTVTKTRVRAPTPPQNKDASAVANMLAQRGIKITTKQKPPSPPPVPIPNLGSDICITKKSVSTASSSFHVTEEKDNLTLKCDMCHMSYSSFSQLQEHKRQFHNSKSEMGLPVIDLSNEHNLIKLQNLGITNFIPLANREQSGGCFGIPVLSVHNSLNGSLSSSLQSLGVGGILSLGPVKPIPKY